MNAVNAPSGLYHKARRELALELEKVGAVLTAASDHPLVVERQGPNGMERGFKLKLHEKNPDAPLSPIFLNLRVPDNPKPGPLTEYLVELSAYCMRHIILEEGLVFDAVAGVPRAGDPFAQALARLTEKPCISMSKWEYNGKRSIASLTGTVPASVRRAILVDDLVTKADSKVEAVKVFQDASIDVSDIVVLVDREQGGRKELVEWNCNLHSVYTISELLGIFVAVGRMQPQFRADILKYLAAA